jgi:ribosomal protein L29
MKNTAIRNMSDKEIEKALTEKRALVSQFRFDMAGKKVKNQKDGSNAKKAVARLLTERATRDN